MKKRVRFWGVPFLAAAAFSLAFVTTSFEPSPNVIFGLIRSVTQASSQPLITAAPKPVFNFQATDSTRPEIFSKAALIADLASLTSVFSKNASGVLEPASTTKITTAIVALNYFSPDKDLIVPNTCLGLPGSNIGLVPGEIIKFKDILYGVLLPSASDATCTVYSNYAGGQVGFLAAMNNFADSLGATNTFFGNSFGFDDGSFTANKTTASDLAVITKEALKNPVFKEVVGTKVATVSSIDGSISHFLQNTNQLLGQIEGVYGVKTGNTDVAGQCLVTAVKVKDRDFIIVVLGSPDRFGETKKLIEWLKNSVTW